MEFGRGGTDSVAESSGRLAHRWSDGPGDYLHSRPRFWGHPMLRTALLLLVVAPVAAAADEVTVRLENNLLLVEFSQHDGSIVHLRNKANDLELVSATTNSPRPWAMLLAPFQIVSDFTRFELTPNLDQNPPSLQLQWDTSYDITIKAEARLAAQSDELVLTCAAENHGNQTILALRYPAIQGIGTLSSDGAADRLLHSTAMGCLFHDPFHLFQAGSNDPLAAGLVVSRYPNGFHGSALQLMAYYAQDRGGFYFATQDSQCGDKDLNFFKDSSDHLTCEIAHIQWDAQPGKSLAVDYPTVIAAMTEGTWYEAAERYRKWAVQQPWCRRGIRRERVAQGDACHWLLEEIGAVGMWWPFRQDIRDSIARTRQLYGAPLLHLELWWSDEGSRGAAQLEGDRFGPFYFPFLAAKDTTTFQDHRDDQILPNATPINPSWIAMCPAQDGWRNVFIESAEDLVTTRPLRHHQIWIAENHTGCQADCLYYDIGPCAGVPTHCYAGDHQHAPGAGRAVTEGYRSLLTESQQRASSCKGEYVPNGTECVSEPFVDCLDLYYARNAGFGPDMELGNYVRRLTWLPDGQMEAIPLFPFIYHQYGPIAVQGIYPIPPWNAGDSALFLAWAEARAVLWGGLITTFPLTAADTPADHRAAWLRNLVAARTDFAREFLAYGCMQRPPHIECDTIQVDHGLGEEGWLRKARFGSSATDLQQALSLPDQQPGDQKNADGISVEVWAKSMLVLPATPAKSRTMQVPAVLGQAFTLGDDRLGILLAHLQSARPAEIRCTIDPVACGLPPGTYSLTRINGEGQTSLAAFIDRSDVSLSLDPSAVVLLVATRQHQSK